MSENCEVILDILLWYFTFDSLRNHVGCACKWCWKSDCSPVYSSLTCSPMSPLFLNLFSFKSLLMVVSLEEATLRCHFSLLSWFAKSYTASLVSALFQVQTLGACFSHRNWYLHILHSECFSPTHIFSCLAHFVGFQVTPFRDTSPKQPM